MSKQIKPEYMESGDRTLGMVSRILVLWELQRMGKLDLTHGAKTELVKFFGISRPTLDRALAAVADAQAEVDEMLRKLDPDYLTKQLTVEQLARQRFARRDAPGAWLDEDQYNEVLQLAGLSEDKQ